VRERYRGADGVRGGERGRESEVERGKRGSQETKIEREGRRERGREERDGGGGNYEIILSINKFKTLLCQKNHESL